MASEFQKAKLIELKQDFLGEKPGGQTVEVQFNPESLKVSFANQLVQPKAGDQAAGSAGLQFVGAGTTKLALQLWFDVTAMEGNSLDDVRRLTQKVIYFMTPQDSGSEKVPPAVRFAWGSFLFDGMVDSLEESLEFFSSEGKPLRASVALTLSQQKILETKYDDKGGRAGRRGQSPLNSAKAGDSLQAMVAKSGKGNWQSIAAANGIEDPLRLAPGQLIDLNAGASVGVGASSDVSAGVTASARVAVPSLSLNVALGGGSSGSFGVN